MAAAYETPQEVAMSMMMTPQTTFTHHHPSSSFISLPHQEHGVSSSNYGTYWQQETMMNVVKQPYAYSNDFDDTMLTHYSPPSSSSSSSSSLASTTINDPPGMRLNPTTQDIFNFLLPQRLFFGQEAPTALLSLVPEIDLYGGSKSPQEIFGWLREKKYFYFFTRLEKASANGSGKRIKREIKGKGKWSSKGLTHKQLSDVPHKDFVMGTKRQFKFEYFPQYHSSQRDDTISYIMHEYVPTPLFLNYKATQMNILNFDLNNIENIAFCSIYKKVEKNMKRKMNWVLPEESKKIRTEEALEATIHGGSTDNNNRPSLDDIFDDIFNDTAWVDINLDDLLNGLESVDAVEVSE